MDTKNMNLYLDIETIPTSNPDVIAYLKANIKPPATYKKPESIAEWHETHGKQALDEAIHATGLDAAYGSVFCISWAIDNGSVNTLSTVGASEYAVLNGFFNCLPTTHAEWSCVLPQPTLIGHNVAGFDLTFLAQRAMILGVKPPAWFVKLTEAKPWDDCIYDTMLKWAGNSKKNPSLDKLCRAFGLPAKGDFDGSMVADAVANGEYQKVIEYCESDVESVRAVHKRMTYT